MIGDVSFAPEAFYLIGINSTAFDIKYKCDYGSIVNLEVIVVIIYEDQIAFYKRYVFYENHINEAYNNTNFNISSNFTTVFNGRCLIGYSDIDFRYDVQGIYFEAVNGLTLKNNDIYSHTLIVLCLQNKTCHPQTPFYDQINDFCYQNASACPVNSYTTDAQAYNCSTCPYYCHLTCDLTNRVTCLTCDYDRTFDNATSTCNCTKYVGTYDIPLNIYCGVDCPTVIPGCKTCLTPIAIPFSCVSCQSQYFKNSSDSLCYLCSTKYLHCIKCPQDAPSCQKCDSDWSLTSNNQCICTVGWEITGTCTSIIGCLSSYKIKGVKSCYACDSARNFKYQNSTCVCQDGFTLPSQVDRYSSCKQTCGDSILFFDQCDDGNTANGDGCSSSCTVQAGYECVNGSFNHVSVCRYIAEFKISLAYVSRTLGENAGQIVLDVSPATDLLNDIEWSKIIALGISSSTRILEQDNENKNNQNQMSQNTLRKLSSIKTPLISYTGGNYSNGKIKIDFNYDASIQNYQASFLVTFNYQQFTSSPASSSFIIDGKNAKLTYDNILFFQTLSYDICLGIAIAAGLQLLLSLFFHKLIGLQTIQILQLIYFTRMTSEDISTTLIYSLEPLLYSNGFNSILYDDERDYSLNRFFTKFSFSKELLLNVNIDYGLIVIAWLLFLIFSVIVKKMNVALKKNAVNKNIASVEQFKISLVRHMRVKSALKDRFVFCFSIFPLFLTFFTYMAAQQTEAAKWTVTPMELSVVFYFFLIYIVLFITSQIIDHIFAKKQEEQEFYKSNGFTSNYLQVYLVYYSLIVPLLAFSCYFHSGIYIVFSVQCIYFIFLLLSRPYLLNFHNFSIIFNQFIVMLWSMYFILLRLNVYTSIVYDYCIIGMVGLFTWLVIQGFIRIIVEKIYFEKTMKEYVLKEEKAKKEHIKMLQEENYQNTFKKYQEDEGVKNQKRSELTREEIKIQKQKEALDELNIFKAKLRNEWRNSKINHENN